MAITALPATLSATIISGTNFSMPNMVNTASTEYRRTIQSIVFYNRETTGDTEYRILFGSKTIYTFTLKPEESFSVEGLKMTQRGDLAGSTTTNDETKITCEVVSTGKTLGANVVISYATITII
jgi:hypothetical protein